MRPPWCPRHSKVLEPSLQRLYHLFCKNLDLGMVQGTTHPRISGCGRGRTANRGLIDDLGRGLSGLCTEPIISWNQQKRSGPNIDPWAPSPPPQQAPIATDLASAMPRQKHLPFSKGLNHCRAVSAIPLASNTDAKRKRSVCEAYAKRRAFN